MRASRNRILALVLAVGALAGAVEAIAKRPIVLKKPATAAKVSREYCGRVFEKEWFAATADVTEAVRNNGFKVGIGSTVNVEIDGVLHEDLVFLGRIVDTEFKTSDYIFKNYADKKTYTVDANRCEIRMQGRIVPPRDLQAMSKTIVQKGETCAAYAIMNFMTQLLEAGVEGNGLLRRELRDPEGYLHLQEEAFEYYMKSRGGANFAPILKKFEKRYGIVCRSFADVTPEYLVKSVTALLHAGKPVILEFFIGPYMKNADFQYIDTAREWVKVDPRTGEVLYGTKVVGEDRRFWAPRARGERESGGHAVVATSIYEARSGRKKMIIKDSDWDNRPIEWDHEKYFVERAKTSGMMAHFCENAK